MMSEPTAGQPAESNPPDYGTPAEPPAHQPTPGTGVSAAMSPQDERSWAIGAHLSAFAAAYVALGLIGPLVVMLVAGPRSAFVRRHAVEALNFNISILIYAAIGLVLTLVLVGIPLLIAIGILYLVSVIRGALAAGRGEEFRYPLTIRFVS